MGKTKEHPRYNVLSFRVSDAELEELESAMIGGSRQDFLLEASLEKARADNQSYMDMAIEKELERRACPQGFKP